MIHAQSRHYVFSDWISQNAKQLIKEQHRGRRGFFALEMAETYQILRQGGREIESKLPYA
jgi:hypothetical protein